MVKSNVKKPRHIVIGVDANYLHKSLVFYRSLSKYHNNFKLHIFCYDNITYKVLESLKYKNINIYHSSEFETKDILKIKKSKERLYEYYWACTPHITLKVLDEQDTDFVSLADCDIMFFSSPEVIFDEFEGVDVILQPNNFSYEFENDFVRYGYYCTSLQCFRKNTNGRKILKYWRGKCIEWCSRKYDIKRFGDQKYLDDWRIRFKKVREVSNIGTNIAPWNVQKFDLSNKSGQVLINNKWPLIYYHFHSFRMNLVNYQYIITGDRNLHYPIRKDVIEYVYKPYVEALIRVVKELKHIREYRRYVKDNPDGNYHVQNLNGKPILT